MAENGKYASVPGKIPGTLVNLGGQNFVMPPLNLDQVQQLEGTMATAKELATIREQIDAMLPVLHAALSRNYPDLTIEELRPLVDMGNFAPVSAALYTSSGFVATKPGEPEPAAP